MARMIRAGATSIERFLSGRTGRACGHLPLENSQTTRQSRGRRVQPTEQPRRYVPLGSRLPQAHICPDAADICHLQLLTFVPTRIAKRHSACQVDTPRGAAIDIESEEA